MATRNHVNYYGLTVSSFRQWQSDEMSIALDPKVQEFLTDPVMVNKVKIFNDAYGVWVTVRDPEKTNPVTRAEDDSIDDINANYKVFHLKINQLKRREKDPDMKIKLTDLVEKDNDYVDLSKTKTSKPLVEEKTEKFLTMYDGLPADVIKKIACQTEVGNIRSSLAVYKTESAKRTSILNETTGKRTAQWPVLNAAMDSLIKCFDMMNDPVTDEKDKVTYPYNSIITFISHQFLKLKNRSDKKGGSSDKSEK